MIPKQLKDVTPDWLTDALRSSGAVERARVVTIDLERVGGGYLGQYARLYLHYDVSEKGAPESVFLKMPLSNGALRESSVAAGLYRTEAQFYESLAPNLGVRVPRCYFSGFDDVGDFVILLEDCVPRFVGIEEGEPTSRELVKIIEDKFAEKTFAEWDAIFREYGFIYAKLQTVKELRDDPQVIANDYITEFDHPAIGPIKVCNFPVAYSETPAGIWNEAPELGQHTEAILIDELGYDWSDIERFQDAGAIL